MPDPEVVRGRVFDPGTKRWYKDGFAPFQLPRIIRAQCGQCDQQTLLIGPKGAWCGNCSPVLERHR